MKLFLKITKYFFITIFAVALAGGGAYFHQVYSEVEQEIGEVKKHRMDVSSQIFDRKGRLIANVFEEKHRLYTRFSDIPPRIVETLLAVEDTMYFEHLGVNPDAISRAAVANLKNMRFAEGGSTITQQVVKNIALSPERTLKRKLKEAVFSIMLERRMSKEEILEIYLNYIFLGHGYYGVRTAAAGYFHKNLSELTLKEICMLMGLPKAPSTYDPTKNLNKSLARANDILNRLHDIGWITTYEYQSALNEVPQVFDEPVTQNLAPYVVDEVLRQLTPLYPDIKKGGYRIQTTIDLDYQLIAQDALKYGYSNLNARLLERYPSVFELDSESILTQDTQAQIKRKETDKRAQVKFSESDFVMAKPKQKYQSDYGELNGAVVITDPKNGDILALVGGVDYRKSVFNRATQAKRQFGSSVKPFIYSIAFDSGYSPAWKVPDVPRSFGDEDDEQNEDGESKIWQPSNNGGTYGGLITLKRALTYSANLATLNLVQEVGFGGVYNGIKKFGFQNVPNDMSIILGSFSLSPLDAARAYSLFSNYGTMVEPLLVSKIEKPDYQSPDSQNMENAFQPRAQEFTTPSQAYLITDILKNVVNNGTATATKMKDIEIAGKTGTSNKSVDVWFCGFSPSVQIIVWFGRDNNTPIGPNEVSSRITPPVSAYFFRELLKIEPNLKRKFDVPDGIMKSVISGSEFLYTETSKLPPADSTNSGNMDVDSSIIF